MFHDLLALTAVSVINVAWSNQAAGHVYGAITAGVDDALVAAYRFHDHR